MKLTVVIPCRNEEDNIEECINAIYASKLPTSCEIYVFVVDGMSDDGTLEVIDQLKEKYFNLTVVENTKKLTPFAFNLGIKAGGKVDFVQIIGARQILSENYFVDAIANFERDASIWCVGGKVNNVYLNETGRIISKAMSTTFGMGIGNFRTLPASGFVDTVGTPMYPYKVFEKIGFFDEALIRNQDDDFNYRVIQAGGKIYYDHSISLNYYVRGNYEGLRRQFYQYGYWKVFVNKKHGSVTTIRQLIPPLFVLYLILTMPMLFFGMTLFLISLIPLIIYFMLNVLFSIKSAEKSSDFLELTITYPILHISYGLGYLKGILEFLILKNEPADSQKRLSR